MRAGGFPERHKSSYGEDSLENVGDVGYLGEAEGHGGGGGHTIWVPLRSYSRAAVHASTPRCLFKGSGVSAEVLGKESICM